MASTLLCNPAVRPTLTVRRVAQRPAALAPLAALRPGSSFPVQRSVSSTFAAPQQTLSRTLVTVRSSSSSDVAYETYPEGLDGKKDYSPWLAVAAYVAWAYNQFNLDTVVLLKTVAWVQLFVAAASVLVSSFDFTRNKPATVVGPSILAAAVLNVQALSVENVALICFGYFLAERLEPEGSIWIWLATLAAAIYTNNGTLWYTSAFAFWAATRIVRGFQENRVNLSLIPLAGAAGFALYRKEHAAFTLALWIGQVAWTAVRYFATLADKADD